MTKTNVTVKHPGTHNPSDEQLAAAMAEAGVTGTPTGRGIFVSGGPSQIEVDDAPEVPAPKPAKKAAATPPVSE